MNATAEIVAPGARCRIYAACLASYNSGILHGRWIDCDDKDAHQLQAEVDAMLRASPCPDAEEFAIHDHEGFGRMVGEYTSLADVAAIAEGLTGGDAFGFRWLVEDLGLSPQDAAEKAEEVQVFQDAEAWTEEKLLAAYAQDVAEDCYSDALAGLPDFIRHNIDWESVGRDLQISGDVAFFEASGERMLITNPQDF